MSKHIESLEPEVNYSIVEELSSDSDDDNRLIEDYPRYNNVIRKTLENGSTPEDLSYFIPNYTKPTVQTRLIEDRINLNYADTNLALFKRSTISALTGTGYATATMPVFNYIVKNSKELGIDVHDNTTIFALSTANTFIISFVSSFSSTFHYIKQYQKQGSGIPDNCFISFAKLGASFSVVLPLGLLWGIEIHNQKVADSHGFDQYLAWATFSTIPLLLGNTIETVIAVNELTKNKDEIYLQSIGSKIAVYGLSALSIVGRGIAYTEAVKALLIAAGVDDNVSLGLGIAAGGILGASGIGMFEFNAFRTLFAPQYDELTFKKVLGGICATAEGAWFALPLLSIGLKATEEWNPLLKGLIFTPMVISSASYKSVKLYENVASGWDTVTTAFNDWYTGMYETDLGGVDSDYVHTV